VHVNFSVTYVYDVEGHRVAQNSTAGGVTSFAYDGQNVWADLDGSNHVLVRYLYGDGTDKILTRTQGTGVNATVTAYLTDHLGSVRDLEQFSTQTIVGHLDYDGFGNPPPTLPAAADRYGFTEREFDPNTRLQYNRDRWYDPATGRWQSEDPLSFSGRDGNLYRYVGNSPTNAVDPSGQVVVLPTLPAPGGPNLGMFNQLLDGQLNNIISVPEKNYDGNMNPTGPYKTTRPGFYASVDWSINWVIPIDVQAKGRSVIVQEIDYLFEMPIGEVDTHSHFWEVFLFEKDGKAMPPPTWGKDRKFNFDSFRSGIGTPCKKGVGAKLSVTGLASIFNISDELMDYLAKGYETKSPLRPVRLFGVKWFVSSIGTIAGMLATSTKPPFWDKERHIKHSLLVEWNDQGDIVKFETTPK
jgi:RHS repeat-associated protein